MHIDRVNSDPERRRHGLDSAELPDPAAVARIPKDRHSRTTSGAISLSSSSHFALMLYSNSEAGDVAARPRQALDEAGADWVGDADEHDWHGTGRLCSAATVGVPVAQDTSGASATNSAAYPRMRSASSAPQR